ncbi:MAG: hypothetical protein GY717_04980 [Rhodobacteraceae bacterium]|nr:hypothetical protein [Paracoccaceae bacterium]
MISIALYPIVLVGVWALVMIGAVAADLQVPTDTMPLVYGLVFAGLTVALIDLLGLGSVVLGLVSSANLIEYAQLVVPGRTASAVDFMAGLAGVLVGALLVWAARSLVQRNRRVEEIILPGETGDEDCKATACA